jgi:hypothetical protein
VLGTVLVMHPISAQDSMLHGPGALNRELLARVDAIESSRRVVLDIDSTEIPVYGQQEQSAYNGHFESTCYHPLLLFNPLDLGQEHLLPLLGAVDVARSIERATVWG